jgi:ribosome-binding factor A
MDRTRTTGTQPNRLERTLSHLKIISRLMGHELHAQNAPRLTFSREEILEIQTSIDLFIEDAMRSSRGTAGTAREVELPTVEARVN